MSIISPALQGYDRWRRLQLEREPGVRAAGGAVIALQERVQPIQRFLSAFWGDGFEAHRATRSGPAPSLRDEARGPSSRRVVVPDERIAWGERRQPQALAPGRAPGPRAAARPFARDAFEVARRPPVNLAGFDFVARSASPVPSSAGGPQASSFLADVNDLPSTTG